MGRRYHSARNIRSLPVCLCLGLLLFFTAIQKPNQRISEQF